MSESPETPEHSATRQVVQRIQSRKASDVILLKGETDSLAQAYDHAVIVTSPEPSTHRLETSTRSPSPQLPSSHRITPPLRSVTMPGMASPRPYPISVTPTRGIASQERLTNSLDRPQTILTRAGGRPISITLGGVRSKPISTTSSSHVRPSKKSRNAGSFKLKVNH